MAVKLFLDDHEVITDSSQEIKITRENPYFTLSDSYTLDVTIPLDILQNRKFFGSIQRIERKKEYQEFASRLYCANALLMEGTARIVQSTEQAVKVQLACGVSALKMSSEQEGTYIDSLITEREGGGAILPQDLDYGPTVGENHTGYGVPVLDNTNDTVVNLTTEQVIEFRRGFYTSECPRLTGLASLVAARLGYTIDMSALPAACEHIYVMSATHGNLGKKLPHWTVKEFFRQFQNFFGCTLVRTGNKSLRLVPLDSFVQNPVTTITPLYEFQAEYSEEDDAEGIMNRNVEFEMVNSDIETVDEEILAQAQYTGEYNSASAMSSAFNTDSEEVRMRKIYKLNGEMYVGWEVSEGTYELKRVAPFNPLKRFNGAESVKLKIAPAFIQEDVECEIWDGGAVSQSSMRYAFSIHVPSVANPYGLIKDWSWDGSQATASEDNKPTLQSLVEGSETIVSEEDKADVMSVAFVDGRAETVAAHRVEGDGQTSHTIHLAFTDYNFKRQLSNNRSMWSLSLNELRGYDFYLGQLHRLTFRCSHQVKHLFRFLSDSIPEPTDVFLIHGKRFACEKIEASIRDGNLDKLMTGYFYEITS